MTKDQTLRCDMCHAPLKSRRYLITTLMRPDLTLTVGPECYRKEKKARAEMLARHTPEEIEAIRTRIAAKCVQTA
jgi:hypothetical protein